MSANPKGMSVNPRREEVNPTLKNKWLEEIYPGIKKQGPHWMTRDKQRRAFLMGYERAIMDVKDRLMFKIMEEEGNGIS